MDIKAYIESGILESYVLGTTTHEETLYVQKLAEQHIEVLEEIERIEKSLLNLSDNIVVKTSLDTIQERVLNTKTSSNVISLDSLKEKETKFAGFYKYAAAILFIISLTSVITSIVVNKQAERITEQLAAVKLKEQEASEKLKHIDSLNTKLNTELSLVTNEHNRIVKLNGAGVDSTAKATLYWNTETKQVVLKPLNLRKLEEGKQYQLWAIVDGKPVDAGVFDVVAEEVLIKIDKLTAVSQTFAVTIEKQGGVESPTLEQLCLIGNVASR